MARAKNPPPKQDPATESFEAGLKLVSMHPLFAPFAMRTHVIRSGQARYPRQGWAVVSSNGVIVVHPKRSASPQEWLWVLAHCHLHLGMNHFQARLDEREWSLACDCMVYQFLAALKIGKPPDELSGVPIGGLPARNEETLFRHFRENGIPPMFPACSLTGTFESDMVPEIEAPYYHGRGSRQVDWQEVFGEGLRNAVTAAVESAGPKRTDPEGARKRTTAERARDWFISSYPLLGAMASAFTIVEDQLICHRMEIGVAAVNAYAREIYINPAAGLGVEECRFVMAHELLHVALEHQKRRRGRDAELWNVACDYVINGWLIEMGIGRPPLLGLLHDPELKGLSAEAIYDRIVCDLRRFRKLRTFRGVGTGDMLDGDIRDWWMSRDGVDLDGFYRRCLAQGFQLHCEGGRGLLPAGLIEEIRALSQPPIPWDVELAKWFDHRFPPRDRKQSYARASRRQSSTPDIPRPRWVSAGLDPERTFGVVLDTSGSMDRVMLAGALGAIASYAVSREVGAVRVVFCDAAAYDQGYMAPEEIAGRVQVKGRGGTVLQPGIDMLERADDFPRNGPLLIITDGQCDAFEVRREHAILLPEGRSLPMPARGPVFYCG